MRFQKLITFAAVLAMIACAVFSVCMLASASVEEIVLFEETAKSNPYKKSLSSEKTDCWFKQVPAILNDIKEYGAICPEDGEYYEITMTGYVSAGTATLHMGENNSWEEYSGTSGTLTTESSTITAKIPVKVWGVEGNIFVCDAGELGHTVYWTYLKVSVFRITGPENSDTSEPTESNEPSASETSLAPAPVSYGDANADGAIDMKDVLAIRKYLAQMNVTIDTANADANADGSIDMKDVLLIRKYLVGLAELPTAPTEESRETTTKEPTTTTRYKRPTTEVSVTDDPAHPDQITLSFYDAEAKSYGVTWHTYQEAAKPVLQFTEADDSGAANWTGTGVVTVEADTTKYEPISMPYDAPSNTFVYGWNIETKEDYSHKAVMNNLKAGGTYVYRVGDAANTNGWSSDMTFKVPDRSADSFSFAEFSDTQVQSAVNTNAYTYMRNAIVGAFKEDPDLAFMINAGDFVQCSKYLHLWRSLLNGSSDYLTSHVLMPVTGNHDSIYATAGSYELNKHFNIAFPEENNVPQYGEFYSFDYGPAHFVCLNTDCMASADGLLDDTQLNWLKSDLENAENEWTIVLLHRPLVAVRSAEEYPHMNQLIGVFNDYGVDLVVQAHEHTYTRSYPINGNKEALTDTEITTQDDIEYYVNPQGVLFVTGATGGSDGKEPYDTYPASYVNFTSAGRPSSWCTFTVDSEKITVEAHYYENGEVKTYENGIWGIMKKDS